MEKDEAMQDCASSSGDSDSDEELDVDLQGLDAAVAANPLNYEAHLQFVNSLRKMGNLDKLRVAREAMSSLFPLPGEMWREWAKDEANLLSGDGSDDISSVEALYERGVKEYLCVPLWLDYLEFVEERDMTVAQCTPEGLTKMRGLYEKAINAAGLHFAEGSLIWNAYREFENAVLVAMANQDTKEVEVQAQRVRSLFHRQLAVPLSTHASTLEEFIDWEKEQGKVIGGVDEQFAGMDPNVLSAYRKAEAACLDYKIFEENVQGKPSSDPELSQNFLLYISFEQERSGSDPARVQVLFERALAVFPIYPDVWLKYTTYLDQKLKIPSVCKSTHARAVRNCPWVEELWRKSIQALERFSSSEEEISDVFERSIQNTFQTPSEYLNLFLTRIDGLRRQNASPDRLRGAFQRASEFLATYFPDFVDRSLLQLHGYWARSEVRFSKDVEAARAVWEGSIKSSGWMTEVWQEYIAMEVGLGNIKAAQKLYKRCYSRKLEGGGSEVICLAWLQFEREFGSLEDFDTASIKAGQRLEELRSLQLVQETKDTVTKTKPKAKRNNDEQEQGKTGGKEEEPKRKREKDVKEVKKRPKKTFPVREAEPQKPVQENAAPDVPTGGEGDTSTQPKQKHVHRDELTAFVSNLAIELTADDLKQFFASCGGLKGIRLPKDRNTGRSRGIAYVDFATEENLAAAVRMNKRRIGERRVSVARSKPKPKAAEGVKPNLSETPRPVKPLGSKGGKRGLGTETNEGEMSEVPPPVKSNDEFRKMFIKAETKEAETKEVEMSEPSSSAVQSNDRN